MRYLLGNNLLITIFALLLLGGCNLNNVGKYQEQIIYSINRTIWVMNSDGTNQHQLLEPQFTGVDPKWSPDGRKVAFTSMDSDGKWAIWVAEASGKNPYRATIGFDSVQAEWLNPNILLMEVVTDTSNTWNNPAGQFIVDLESGKTEEYQEGYAVNKPFYSGVKWLSFQTASVARVYSIDKEYTNVLHGYCVEGPWQFDVSPSGDQIAFSGSECSTENQFSPSGIYRAKLSDPNQVIAIRLQDSNGFPTIRWSPDGKWIATLNNKNRLQIINTENNQVSNSYLFEFDRFDAYLQWSPDSQWLLIASVNFGIPGGQKISELAKINRKTGEIIRLTNNDEIVSLPDWELVRLE